MDQNDFYRGLKTDREENREHVDAAEHFVRLKQQAGLVPDQDAELEKEAVSERFLWDMTQKARDGEISSARRGRFNRSMERLDTPGEVGNVKARAAGNYASTYFGNANDAPEMRQSARAGIAAQRAAGGAPAADPASIASANSRRPYVPPTQAQAAAPAPIAAASHSAPALSHAPVAAPSRLNAAVRGGGLLQGAASGYPGSSMSRAVTRPGAGSAALGFGKKMLTKFAGLPMPTRGDISPRTFDHEGSPAAGMDQRKGYNFTAVHHEGKNHILVDHHSSGRVGHLIADPGTGAVEQSEVHPSHKHMANRFHEHAAMMHQHLQSARGPQVAPAPDDGIPKLASLLRDRLRKMANMGGASSPSLNGGIKPIPPVGGGGPGPKPPTVPGMGGSSMTGGADAGIGKLAETIDPEIREAITAGPPKIGYGTIAMHLIDKMSKNEPPPKHKGKTKKAGIMAHLKDPRKVIPAAIGAAGLGGGTYLSAKPRKHLGGRSKAEAETEAHVRSQHHEGEQGAGYVKKMKNRLTEFNHGSAQAQRQHPVKASLANGAVGAALGLAASRALGGKK